MSTRPRVPYFPNSKLPFFSFHIAHFLLFRVPNMNYTVPIYNNGRRLPTRVEL